MRLDEGVCDDDCSSYHTSWSQNQLRSSCRTQHFEHRLRGQTAIGKLLPCHGTQRGSMISAPVPLGNRCLPHPSLLIAHISRTIALRRTLGFGPNAYQCTKQNITQHLTSQPLLTTTHQPVTISASERLPSHLGVMHNLSILSFSHTLLFHFSILVSTWKRNGFTR